MQFSTHIKNISEDFRNALHEPKKKLVLNLKTSIQKSGELLKDDCFEFWLKQIDDHPIAEIPITKFGVNNARSIWEEPASDRHGLKGAVQDSCESILTYCAEDDVCEKQADFHYYYHIPTQQVFKESELGSCPNPSIQINNIHEMRIALISELHIEIDELYT